MLEESIDIVTPHVAATLALRRSGSGPVIVFLHGWAHSAQVWQEIIPHFEATNTCIAVDLPGFGASAPLASKHITLERYAEIVWCLVTDLARLRAVHGVVADSMGALLALDCVSRLERLPTERFFLSGVPLDGMPKLIRDVHAHALTGVSLAFLRVLPFPIANLLVSRSNHLTVHHRGKFERIITDMIRHSDPETAGKLLREMYYPYDLSDHFDASRYHLTLCRGSHDQVFRDIALAPWAQALAAQVAVVPDAGHTPMLENPNDYARACAAAWERVETAPVEGG